MVSIDVKFDEVGGLESFPVQDVDEKESDVSLDAGVERL